MRSFIGSGLFLGVKQENDKSRGDFEYGMVAAAGWNLEARPVPSRDMLAGRTGDGRTLRDRCFE